MQQENIMEYPQKLFSRWRCIFSFKELTNSEFCFLFREHSPNTANALCEAINTLKLVQLGELENGIKIGKI